MISLFAAFCANYEALIADIYAKHNIERLPVIREVDKNHFMVSRPGAYNNKAVAALTSKGYEVLFINTDASNSRECRALLEHEVAHFLTWRKYGPNVKMHGSEFRKICRSIASGSKRATCH